MSKIIGKIIEKLVDIVLISVYFNLEAPNYIRSGKRWQISQIVSDDLEKYNYQNIRNAFYYLKKKGLIQTFKEKSRLPIITQIGKKKLNSIIPFYDKERVWDERIYLVTYDLPIEKNKDRNALRIYLKKIGCGMLQKSIWITPYNPAEILRQYFNENNLNEFIIISSIGKDGTIGSLDLLELVRIVYKLDVINQRYREFINETKDKTASKNKLAFSYLSILNDDPQLPFKLLPEDWLGDRAHSLFENIIKPVE